MVSVTIAKQQVHFQKDKVLELSATGLNTITGDGFRVMTSQKTIPNHLAWLRKDAIDFVIVVTLKTDRWSGNIMGSDVTQTTVQGCNTSYMTIPCGGIYSISMQRQDQADGSKLLVQVCCLCTQTPKSELQSIRCCIGDGNISVYNLG
jgi:hypothetical protein